MLVLIPNWLGDVAMCTPALRSLRRRFPDAAITVAGQAAGCQLLAGLPWIHQSIPLPARPGIGQLVQLGRMLKAPAQDCCVVFPHSFRAGLLAFLTRAQRRLGYDRGNRRWLLTETVAPHREQGRITPIYMAREYLDLLRPLGCEDDGLGLELAVDPAEARATQARLPGDGPLVALAPGAAFGPSKRWLPERYAEVANRLMEQCNARCVLLTGPGEEETRAAVQAAARHPFLDPYQGAPSIEKLKAAIQAADLLICNDSGPRHMGVAFKKPVICIMGSTSPRYTDSPWEIGRVIRIDVDCGPCQKPICATDHRCMTGISADTVVEAALEYLK